MGERPERAKCRDQDRVASDVVPFLDGSNPFVGCDHGQESGSQEISQERDEHRTADEAAADECAEAEHFPKKQRCHDAALQRAHPAACLLHAECASGKCDEMSTANGFIPEPMQHLESRNGVFFHEESHDCLFCISGPWDRDDEKAHRKKKMPQPARAADRVNQEESQKNRAERARDAWHAPLGVCFEEWLDSRKKTQRRQGQQCHDPKASMGVRLRAVPPPLQKEREADDRDQKSIAILRVQFPFVPKHPDRHPPDRGQGRSN